MLSKMIGGGSIAIIVILGIWFNMPHANNQFVNGITTFNTNTKPPDFQSISGYINTGPIYHIIQLKGWVVLVHFWRLGCPDCQAEMGFINYLWNQYHKFGLMIIGIHSPEFDNEKDYNQIKQAVVADNIKWPVLIDNTRQTWNAYGDGFWPRDALVGKNGFERFTHIGNGDQKQIEDNIRFLLTERNVPLT